MIYLASNRLPVTLTFSKGRVALSPSPGGVATGLAGIAQGAHKVAWVGWPGAVSPQRQARAVRAMAREPGLVPVFLPERLVRGYYNGFSNRSLWPLFHSFPTRARFVEGEWAAYREANELFASALARRVRPGDLVWIHDYHLLLVPQLLRERVPRARIGFFLHIPFPQHETLRLLPWSREILEGLLGADLVGFHTYDYAQAYLGGLRRLLGIDNALGEVSAGGRTVQVDVFPMGIDVGSFAGAADDPIVRQHMRRIRARFGERKLMLSVSRLDYTKGIPGELAALEKFLEDNPRWRGRFKHLLVVVPSRERVDGYAALKREIDELVGRINGRFGRIDWTPIRYNYRYLPFAELAALYAAADVALVTPARDGMNLVAKEYVATKADGNGVLILSEMAGAARELLEALIVNPNSKEEVAAAIAAAFEMRPEERRRRVEAMHARLRANDLERWRGRFLTKLEDAAGRSRAMAARRLPAHDRARLVRGYRQARRRLVFLDYDGTLAPLVPDPSAASPAPEVTRLLGQLAAAPGTEVVIVSGRDRASLARWLGHLPVTLSAEHGTWLRRRGSIEWELAVRTHSGWKEQLRPVFQLFVERIPGSHLEEKDFAMVWHYRRADPKFGTDAARELLEALTALTANTELVVLPGHRVVEVKPAASSKGALYVRNFAGRAWDFVMAIGDDATDETLFRVLPSTAFSIRVGMASSAARFNVDGVPDVLRLLRALEAPGASRAGAGRTLRSDGSSGAGRPRRSLQGPRRNPPDKTLDVGVDKRHRAYDR
jgi:trehalose 6-phosphate synthase/phosphatase